MTDYSPNEIVDIIIEYGRTNENYRQPLPLVCSTVFRSPQSYYNNEINRARKGKLCRKRKKKSLTDANDLNTAVLGMVVINPQIGQRTISRELNVSQLTTQRILKANNFHAYHIQVQALTENQKQKRVEFCYWGLEKLEDSTFLISKNTEIQNSNKEGQGLMGIGAVISAQVKFT